MFENYAVKYLSGLTEAQHDLANYGWVILGALLAVFLFKPNAPIPRSTFFLKASFILFLFAATNSVWLLGMDAAENNYLSFVLVIFVLSSIAIGGMFCHACMARSMDAFGSRAYAGLGFIPFINLVLIFRGTKNSVSYEKPARMRGFLFVALGVFILGVTLAVRVGLEQSLSTKVAELKNPETNNVKAVESLIQKYGLQSMLRAMATGMDLPYKVDQITDITSLDVNGVELIRTYVINAEGVVIDDAFIADSRKRICAYATITPVLKSGGAIREVYLETSGKRIADYLVTIDDCVF